MPKRHKPPQEERMVIAEAKFRAPPDWQQFVDSRRVREIYGVSPVMAVSRATGKSRFKTTAGRRYGDAHPSGALHHALALMIDQTNENMERLGLDFHISLLRQGEGLALEIFDCTSGVFCEMIGQEDVSLAELPSLLRNLHERAGLLLDVQS